MDKVMMLEQMISHYSDGNKARFASRLGIRPQTINSWLTRNSFDSELIFAKCEGISPGWLLSGEGEMLIKQSEYPNLPIALKGEASYSVPIKAIEKAKAKIVVEIDLDDDEFVKLGLSSKIIQVLKQK